MSDSSGRQKKVVAVHYDSSQMATKSAINRVGSSESHEIIKMPQATEKNKIKEEEEETCECKIGILTQIG